MFFCIVKIYYWKAVNLLTKYTATIEVTEDLRKMKWLIHSFLELTKLYLFYIG